MELKISLKKSIWINIPYIIVSFVILYICIDLARLSPLSLEIIPYILILIFFVIFFLLCQIGIALNHIEEYLKRK